MERLGRAIPRLRDREVAVREMGIDRIQSLNRSSFVPQSRDLLLHRGFGVTCLRRTTAWQARRRDPPSLIYGAAGKKPRRQRVLKTENGSSFVPQLRDYGATRTLNGANGMSDPPTPTRYGAAGIEGKVTRVGATKRGQQRSFKSETEPTSVVDDDVCSVSLSLIPCVTR
jgi:hypothetical protein